MRKREIDIFGILLGVVIGCILGFFLSTRISLDGTIVDDGSEVSAQVGNIYLLQIKKVTTPADALNSLEEIKGKGLSAISVFDNGNYYIYGGISRTSDGLDVMKEDFVDEGYNPIVKKEYILDKPNAVIDKEDEYGFWVECINNLINSLEGEAVVISDIYTTDPINLEELTNMLALETIKNEKLLNEIRLNTYKLIVENLG